MSTKWAVFALSDETAAAFNDDGGAFDALMNPGIVGICDNRPEPTDLVWLGQEFIRSLHPDLDFEAHRSPDQVEFALSDGSVVVVFCQQVPYAQNLLFIRPTFV